MTSAETAPTGVAYHWCAAPVAGGRGVGSGEHERVVPASVMKVQIALTVATAIAEGRLDGTARIRIPGAGRTPGPVGLSLMKDEAVLSVRDLLVLMMTVSDNVATDVLLDLVGLEAVNAATSRLGLADTLIVDSLGDMLEEMAREAGFADFADLDAHGGPDLRTRLATTSAFDIARGTHTTAADSVRLLQLVWTDQAGPAAACAQVRHLMTNQLTRSRIASGAPADASVAAKSGGRMGLVRNEIGVVTLPGDAAYAVAVFARMEPDAGVDPRTVDHTIGRIAADAVASLHG